MRFQTIKINSFSLIWCSLVAQSFAFGSNKTNFYGLQKLDTTFGTPQGYELKFIDDALRSSFRSYRQWMYVHKARPLQLVRNGKIQSTIPTDTPFPCDVNFSRSLTPPTTVNELRPGDIDIIAAIGDSLTAGTCLKAENILQLLSENRGLAFSGGGEGDWRTFLTLPNILKVFNPKLYGYSIADSLAYQRESRFNVAEPAAMSRDLVYQAKNLIQRMRRDPKVDMKRHWKVLTILMGNLDICSDYCTYENVSLPLFHHEQNLRQSLTLLRDNIPRLFVNLIPAPNPIWALRKLNMSPYCYWMHNLCFCAKGANQTDEYRRAYDKKIHLWQNIDARIASLAEFNTNDFTVVFQPFLSDPQIPILPNGNIDQRYFAIDCFHFSQFGNAAVANSLWNSMLQPVGHKQLSFNKPYERFECPSTKRPYLATRENS